MAKKLKYPYEQWKEQQNKPSSRSPSPMEAAEDEGFSSSSSSPQMLLSQMSDCPESSRHIYGKWCSTHASQTLFFKMTSHNFYDKGV
jgi:hypothetical protein